MFIHVFPDLVNQYQDLCSLILILIAGVPHGAADHLLFEKMNISFFGARNKYSFLIKYIFLGFVFFIFWSFDPFKALLLFIAISIYHFGQEHFSKFDPENIWSKISYILWGSFVLIFPLVWNAADTTKIITEITGITLPAITSFVQHWILSFLILGNIVLLVIHFRFNRISRTELIQQIIQILFLALIFLKLPLLLGFSIYFVFWHSLHAIKDQITFLKKSNSNYSGLTYLRDVIPFSTLAISFIVGVSYLAGYDLMSPNEPQRI